MYKYSHEVLILLLRLKPGLHIVVMVVSTVANVSDSVPSSFDTREHFDYDNASLTGTLINCSVSSSCNDGINH